MPARGPPLACGLKILTMASGAAYREDGIRLLSRPSGGGWFRVHVLADQEDAAAAAVVAVAADSSEPGPSPYDALLKRDGERVLLELDTIDPTRFGAIVGRGGATLKALQRTTNTTITVPGKGSPSRVVLVAGPRAGVVAAAAQLERAAGAVPFTHFISLPLNDAALQSSVRELVADASTRGLMDAALATNVDHLHLTLFMLALPTEEDVARAAQALQSMSAALYDVCKTRTLLVRVQGLACMESDPSAAHCVYARVEDASSDGSLAALVERVGQELEQAGLITASQRSVKLHTTLWNTRFIAGPRAPVDARALLARHGTAAINVVVRIPAVELSTRGAYGDDGYYACAHRARLP